MTPPETTYSPVTKISVLLAVHNGAKTLERCLESVCRQTYRNISVVLVNDKSNDTTMEVVRQIEKSYPHISFTIIQNEENVGLTRSLNRGLSMIRSPYTARIDADDWWELDKLDKQLAFLEAHPKCGIVGTNYINHGPAGPQKVIKPETHAQISRMIFWRNPFAHSAVCFRTDLVRGQGNYNEKYRYSQDYELWIRCFPQTQFHNLQEFLCHRTLGSGVSVDHQNMQMRLYLNTLLKYLPKYSRPWYEYGACLEPLAVLLSPNWLKRLKRRYLP